MYHYNFLYWQILLDVICLIVLEVPSYPSKLPPNNELEVLCKHFVQPNVFCLNAHRIYCIDNSLSILITDNSWLIRTTYIKSSLTCRTPGFQMVRH